MRQKQALIIAFAVLLLDSIATGLFTAIILHLLVIEDTPGNINRTAEDVLFGSGFLVLLSPAYLLAAPILGYCSDIFGRRRLLLVTTICDCIGYLLCLLSLFTNNIIILLLGLALLGIGNSNLCLTLTVAADVTNSNNKPLMFAIIAIITNVLVFAALFGNQILARFAYSPACYESLVAVIFCIELFNLFLLISFLPETNTKPNRRANFSIDDAFKALTLLLSKKQTRLLLFTFFIVEFASGLYNQYIFTYLTAILHTTSQHAMWFVNYRTLIMLVSLLILFPILLYRFSLKNLLIFCFILTSIGLFGASILPFTLAQWFFCLFIASGFAMLEPVIWTLLSNCVSRFHQGLILGLINPVWMLAWMTSGAIGDTSEANQTVPLWLSFFVLILGITMLYYKITRQKRAVTC